MKTVLIIGGGASGMAAALSASASPDNCVVLLERQVRVGRKLAIAGLIVSIITIVFYVILFVIALNGNDFSLYKPPTTKL